MYGALAHTGIGTGLLTVMGLGLTFGGWIMTKIARKK